MCLPPSYEPNTAYGRLGMLFITVLNVVEIFTAGGLSTFVTLRQMRPFNNSFAAARGCSSITFKSKRIIDMRKLAITTAAALAFTCGAAFAQSGNVSIPGLVSGKGSAGSEITNSRITVSNNKATGVVAGGGKAGMKVAEISMDGVANVNSVNITGSKIRNSEITVTGNEATDIKAIGGTANVNSVNIN